MDKYKGYLKRHEYELSSITVKHKRLTKFYSMYHFKKRPRIHYIKNINMVLKYTDFFSHLNCYQYFLKKISAVIRLRQYLIKLRKKAYEH